MYIIVIIVTIAITLLFGMAFKVLLTPYAFEIKSKENYTIAKVYTKEEAKQIIKNHNDYICKKIY